MAMNGTEPTKGKTGGPLTPKNVKMPLEFGTLIQDDNFHLFQITRKSFNIY